MSKMWNKKVESMSRDEIFAVQSENLRRTVEKVYHNVPFCRAKMDKEGVLPGDIKTAADIVKLPFTNKQDLRDTYPFGLFAVPMDKVVRIHASSGTTGKQTVVGYTKNDLDTWSEIVARCLTMAGADKSSVVQISYGYGLFTGGLGAHGGAEKIGATVVPTSTGNTARQVTVMQDFGTSVLCCTPSYALFIAETLEQMGIDRSTMKLKTGIFGAEPWTEPMRAEIERRLGIDAHDIYGLSEVMGPGVSMDCEYKNGLHIWEDHFLPEIINPETGEQMGDNVNGELVFSCITKEALPLLRYRTHDVSSLDRSTCACGRTHARMAKPSGRTDDMLIIRGVNVFPSQIESVLLDVGETSPHYMIYVDRKDNLDIMEVQIEVSESVFSDKVRTLEDLGGKIRSRLDSVLGISAKVRLVEPGSIPRSEGKAKRVVDRRTL